MALTLAEANKYSTNQVLVGVAEISVQVNPLLALMPFVPIRGNALQYQRELAAAAPTFIAAGGTVTEATPTTTQCTAALKILISDADIDKFLAITRSKDQDLVAELLTIKARNFADVWGDKAIYGTTVSTEEFDGLHRLISGDATGQQVHAGATTVLGAGSFSLLDQLIDLVKPRPTCLIASRRSIRGIQKLARSQGWDLALSTVQGINRPVRFYSDVPILPCDFILDTETISSGAYALPTTGLGSSIFACRLEDTGLFGISADDPNAQDDLERIIQLENVGTLETKDANRIRMKAYTAIVLKATEAVARLDGISGALDWTN
jgi:hypothetical protein